MISKFLRAAGRNAKAPQASRLYLKLRSRLLFLYFLMVLLPLLLLILFLISFLKDTAVNNYCNTSEAGLFLAEKSTDRLLGNLDDNFTAVRERVEEATISAGNLEKVTNEIGRLAERKACGDAAGKLAGAFLVSRDRTVSLFTADAQSPVTDVLSRQPLFTNAVNHSGSILHAISIRFTRNSTGKPVITVASALGSDHAGTGKQVLVLDFDYNLLSDIAEQSGFNPSLPSEFMIISSDGTVIYSKSPGLVTLAADSSVTDLVSAGQTGKSRIIYNDNPYFAVFKKSTGTGWSYISLISENSLTAGMFTWETWISLFLGLAVLSVLLLFPVLFLRLLSPINKLTSVISGQEKSKYFLAQNIEDRNRRIPGNPLNTTSSDLDYLIDKVYTLNLKQKEAELNALQNQINPHFLYNTLESIRGAALFHGIHDIAAMSRALSLMFRYSISSTVLVTVKEEIQHLENYMSIQNFRYENKFDLVYEIPDELYQYKILKLTLQPLIENSIRHGLEMKLGKGTIKVTMFRLDHMIKINVSDDGTGIPQKRVEELNRMLAAEEPLPTMSESSGKPGTGIGVKNVNSRIKLYFGELYGLKFLNTLSGTMVEIVLPEVTL